MEKKTIGTFIAALRKANGLTQQELADKLNVSNKAVSRWERDECAPDITLVPALAEIFGVTCDELLKGERILSDTKEKSEKIDKQVKALFNRAITNFLTLIWISLALSVFGFVCMQVLTYNILKPEIVDVVLCVFCVLIVSAFVIAAIATTKLRGVKWENELFENADEAVIKKYNNALGYFSLVAFFAVIAVIAFSFFQIFFFNISSDYEVISHFISFLTTVCFIGIMWIIVKDRYYLWITKQPRKKANSKLVLMNSLQLTATGLASILFLVSPYFVEKPYGSPNIAVLVSAYALIAVNVLSFIVLISKCKPERKMLLLPGLRNLFMIIPSILVQLVHSSFLHNYGSVTSPDWHRVDVWSINYILLVFGVTLFILVIFEVIKVVMRKKAK